MKNLKKLTFKEISDSSDVIYDENVLQGVIGGYGTTRPPGVAYEVDLETVQIVGKLIQDTWDMGLWAFDNENPDNTMDPGTWYMERLRTVGDSYIGDIPYVGDEVSELWGQFVDWGISNWQQDKELVKQSWGNFVNNVVYPY